MRLSQFDLSAESIRVSQRLFQWTIRVSAKVAGRLSPRDADSLRVFFPLLNCTVANVREVQMRGTGDCGQEISFMVDLALFAENERLSLVQIDGATCLDVVGNDTTLNLIEPQLTVLPHTGDQTDLLSFSC